MNFKRLIQGLVISILFLCAACSSETPIPTNDISSIETTSVAYQEQPTATTESSLTPNVTSTTNQSSWTTSSTSVSTTAQDNTETPQPKVVALTETPFEIFTLQEFSRSWLTFASWGYDSGIFVMRPDTSEIIHLINEGLSDSPAWSPDGHWIIFASRAEKNEAGWIGGNSDLYVVKKDGSQTKRLTDSGNLDEIYPAWSPNGEYIVYVGRDAEEVYPKGDLYVIRASGGAPHKITNNLLDNLYPVWHPDGQTILFVAIESPVRNQFHSYLTMIDSTGENETRLFELPDAHGKFALSPDGNQIVYRSYGDGCGDLYLIDIDGNNLRQLTDTPGREKDPSFSPDGRFITYNATEICKRNKAEGVASGWEIYILDIETGYSLKITDNTRDWYPLEPAWSPVPAFEIGSEYTITEAGNNLNLRETASLDGSLVQKLETGDIVSILEGPVDVDGYYWWKMRTDEGIEGWAVEVVGWYTPKK